ncbi:uncharacterized protein ldbr [Palaemon carinicauda]|uniref:uncharacterized protein ldbr n=1 Tax=Palaemon carinicauda TaxID=392227 RepID=UPI0035B69A8D
MHIAVEGCSHGELDTIYRAIQKLEEIHKLKIDLLICCGDFQSVRNEQDLRCMACPAKYMEMHDFYKYHSGEKQAPVLTLFIGGNHEASNYLQELPYGGWVAPNIFYMGYASIVRFGGLRIGGLSGIYKGPDYLKGHFEKTPYSADTTRSVYHVRNLEVFRLKQLSGDNDIFISHDWPRGIYQHGPKERLLKFKKHFRKEIMSNTLGSRPAEELLKKLQPKFWFSGHLHIKFAALLKHQDENTHKPKITKFLALDKCLPRRDFLQVIEVPTTEPLELKYDAEWLTILRLTNHLLSVSSRAVYMPGPGGTERYQFTPTPEEIEETTDMMDGDLKIPLNFAPTARSYNESQGKPKMDYVRMPQPLMNPQTVNLCSKLGIDDPVALLLGIKKSALSSPRLTPPRSSLNSSEMNITLESSKLSVTNVDEIEVSDDDTGDIIMEMRLSPEPEDKLSNKIEEVVSPIRGESESILEDEDAVRQPASSSPRTPISRRELRLSDPKIDGGSSPLPFSIDSSSASSSLSEGELSPSQSPGTKRTNDESEKEISQASVSSSSASSGGNRIKKIKRRNQAIYSSTEEEG